MTYGETLDFLFNRLQSFHNNGAIAYKPGLDRARRLAAQFCNPQERFRAVHVGGTNGKGSTSHSLAAVLTEAGLKTGLYTSPHLLDFRERIRIDGTPIDEDDVVDFIERFLRESPHDMDPSFFELTTIMALDYFARNGVDIAVIEVGLGGRLDTTNIVEPCLSVITNISFDHTDLLGDTLAKIAMEKAGIFRHSVPAVVGRRHPETDPVFDKAKSGSIIYAADNPLYTECLYDKEGPYYIYRNTPWGDIRSELTGSCQPENMATVLNALKVLEEQQICRLDNRIVDNALRQVCKNTGLMGRWMQICDDPKVVTDTAHNVDGFKYIMERLSDMDPKNLFFVLGFVGDKDISGIMEMLPAEANYFWVEPSVRRASSAAATAAKARERGLGGKVCGAVINGVEEAVENARQCPGSFVYVGGSTFVVADCLASFSRPT